jgi:hypothetical protein
VEILADAAQSIDSNVSPGWYGLELATFEPCPRFALFTLPKASPTSRRRGVSGKVSSVGPLTDANDLAVAQGRLGPRSSFEAARFEVL